MSRGCPSDDTLVLLADAALETTALETTALETTALETTALETTALETTALETTALETAALETRAATRDVARHVEGCAACGARVRALRALDAVLAEGGAPPPGLQARLRTIPERVPARGRLRPLPVAAAAAAALLLVGLLAGPAETPGPRRPAPPTATATPAARDDAGGSAREEQAPAAPVALHARVRTALDAGEVGAAIQLAALGERALPALHVAARGPDAARAERAIRELGRRGRRASLPVLVSLLEDDARRAAAIDALADLGAPDAVAALEPFVADARHGAAALQAVIRLGGPDAVDVVARRAAGADRAEAGVLVAALARIDGPAGARALARLSRARPDVDPAIRMAVAGHRAVRRHLAALAGGRHPQDAAAALGLLEQTATPDLVDALVPLLEDRHRRGSAARALAHADSEAAARALVAHAGADAVRAAFADVGPAVASWLRGRAAGASHHERRRAIELLGLAGDPGALEVLAAAAHDRALAPHAVEAIGRVGGPAAVDTLRALAATPLLRPHVVAALGRTRAPAAVDLLERLGGDRALRGPAIEALSGIDHPAAVAAIVRIDGGGRVRSGTARALRRMDRDLVTGTLAAMLETGDARGARHALAALHAEPVP